MPKSDQAEISKIIESLSPNEKTIIPYLKEGSLESINEKTELDKAGVLRAIEFLSNKNILVISTKKQKTIELGVNGLLYVKEGLPERRLANLISEKSSISLQDAKQQSGLNDNEFKAALGVLKKKALINLINSNIILIDKKAISDKTLEEKFLEILPKNLDLLNLKKNTRLRI